MKTVNIKVHFFPQDKQLLSFAEDSELMEALQEAGIPIFAIDPKLEFAISVITESPFAGRGQSAAVTE